MSIVLAFSGKIGSGKSSISASVAQMLGFSLVSFGSYVREQMKLQQPELIEPTRKQLQDLGANLLQDDAIGFCKAVLNQAQNRNVGLVVDGVRHESVLYILRKLVFPQRLFHIHITLDEKIRTERVMQREETISDEHEQRRIITHSTEVQVVELLPSLADLTINSAGELESVAAQVIKQIYRLVKL